MLDLDKFKISDNPEVPPFCIVRGYYNLTRDEFSRVLRHTIERVPVVQFDGLKPGAVYLYQKGPVLSVESVTPSGKQADVVFWRKGDEVAVRVRIYSGAYGGEFRPLNPDLIAMLGVTHEAIIKAFIEECKGIDIAMRGIPAEVRREYPHLFVKIPEHFTVKCAAYTNGIKETAQERVTSALSPCWCVPLKESSVMMIIDREHIELHTIKEARAKVAVVNPDHVKDYDQYVAGHLDTIQFYRWLLPHVSPGGVFYLEPEGGA